jgi:hypothetical protein
MPLLDAFRARFKELLRRRDRVGRTRWAAVWHRLVEA